MIWKVSVLFWALLLALWAGAVQACEQAEFEGAPFTICRADLAQDDIRLFLYDDTGQPYGDFSALPVAPRFAMNGGMYHADRRPVGHYVENTQELMRVIPNAGPGNFGMLPNGVFCVGDTRADVIETLRYVEQTPTCRFATQSGPMLVIDGALHPRFLPDSTSRKIRNGVGTSDDGQQVFFAISDAPVNFHTFARLFRDHLKVNQALFLDGTISRLYAPQIGRNGYGVGMGPIIAVLDKGQ